MEIGLHMTPEDKWAVFGLMSTLVELGLISIEDEFGMWQVWHARRLIDGT